MIHVTNEKIETFYGEQKLLIDFYAEWCGPCRMLTPVVEELAATHPEMKVLKVNVDERPDLAGQFGVMTIPSLFYLEKGEIKQQHTGFLPKEMIESWIK